MRIQYTLPGMQLGKLAELPDEAAGLTSSFKSRLRRLTTAAVLNWRQVLRLDQVCPNAAIIGPPPKPAGVDIADAASERLRWRNLVAREPVGADPSVREMMTLLRTYQSMEDAIVARHLADSRG